MSTVHVWDGLAVVDAHGRPAVWNGSGTPKLYRSEEQGRYALADGQRLVPAQLVFTAPALDVAPVTAAEMPPRNPRKPRKTPAFRPKRCCDCHQEFTPRGAAQKRCGACP